MTANVILPQGGSGRTTYVAKESTPGSSPDTANWDVLRNTGGEGTKAEIETIESAELSGTGLATRDLIRTQVRGVGAYDFELSKNSVFDMFFESLLEGEFATDVLIPGTSVTTMAIEDWLPEVSVGSRANGMRCSALALSLDANQLITGSFTLDGTSASVSSNVEIVDDGATVTFDTSAGSPGEITVTGDVLPTWLGAGNMVMIDATAGDSGYYEITGVAGLVITVAGSTTGISSASGDSLKFYSQSVVDETSGTVNPVNTNSLMRCGDYVQLEINGKDVLDYGFRVPSMTVGIDNTVENLLEITMDSPYAVLNTERAYAMSISYHVINLIPVEMLLDDTEFSMKLVMANMDGDSYTFEWARCKSQNAIPGGASRGEVMTGTWDIIALLDDAGETVKITRSA